LITKKVEHPSWAPPDDIREWNLKTQGIVLPKIMPAGPDNPLGPYAIYMDVPTYLIHSTIFPESIGKRASFGCIRMYEKDIKEFFPSIESGTPVAIINEPTKLGWQGKQLYIESFKPLEEHNKAVDASLEGMHQLIAETTRDRPTLVDWQGVAYLAQIRDGIPHPIGFQLPSAH
jgi:L,D-transpeptidase ErfK/SrfK